MGPKRIGGLVLIIVGIGIAYTGYEISQTVGSQLGRAFGGGPTENVVLRYVAGAICVLVGGYTARG